MSLTSRLTRKLAAAAATVAAVVGVVALPATQAHAQPSVRAAELDCWLSVLSVCAEDVEGNTRQLTKEEPIIVPPLARAENQDDQPWCFYGRPGFEDPVAQLLPREYQQFERPVFSAKPGPCEL